MNELDMRKQTADEVYALRSRAESAEAECNRLRSLMPPDDERSPCAVGEASWSVFAGRVVEERDRLRERVRLAEDHIAHMATLGCRGIACSEHTQCASCYARQVLRASKGGE